MIDPLDKDFMAKRKEAQDAASVFDMEISDRVSFILDTVYKLFGEAEPNWYFPEAEENSIGDFDSSIDGEYVLIYCDNYVSNIKIKTVDGEYVHLNEKIPLRWLFNPFILLIRAVKHNRNVFI